MYYRVVDLGRDYLHTDPTLKKNSKFIFSLNINNDLRDFVAESLSYNRIWILPFGKFGSDSSFNWDFELPDPDSARTP